MSESLKYTFDNLLEPIASYNPSLTRVEGDIPIDLPVNSGSNFMFISKDQRLLTHALHKYPAKFFPELPRWFIQKYTKKGDTVLDPFMGSGTTNLEAIMLGRNTVGIDVDPFSRMLSKAKTTQLPEGDFLKYWCKISKMVKDYQEPSHFRGVPDFPYRDNWFRPYILKELAHIKMCIESLNAQESIHNFFLINFSSIIRACSEADNNCTRTVIRKNHDKKIKPLMAINMFLKKTGFQIDNMVRFSDICGLGEIYIPDEVDAKQMSCVADKSIDCAITSPPYVNAVDYPRTHQLEIYWLGIANGSLRGLKVDQVGTEVVRVADYENLSLVGVPAADKVLRRIYKSDPRRSYIASKYLSDMFQNLVEVYRTLKNGGVYVIVVGDNTIRDTKFETWKYLKDKAPDIGFSVDCYFSSEIINHFIKIPRKQQISRDHILVLRK